MELLNTLFAPMKFLFETLIGYFSKQQKITELSNQVKILKDNNLDTKPLLELLENKIYECQFGVSKDKFMFFYHNPKTKGKYNLIKTIGPYTIGENGNYKVKMDLFMKILNWVFTILAVVITILLTYVFIIKQIDMNYIIIHKKDFGYFAILLILNLVCLSVYTKPLLVIYNYQKSMNNRR